MSLDTVFILSNNGYILKRMIVKYWLIEYLKVKRERIHYQNFTLNMFIHLEEET